MTGKLIRLPPRPSDHVARLVRLLQVISAHERDERDPEVDRAAMERAGFVLRQDRPPAPTGAEILAWVEEREARRRARRR